MGGVFLQVGLSKPLPHFHTVGTLLQKDSFQLSVSGKAPVLGMW